MMDPYENLAQAIILQAVKDYRNCSSGSSAEKELEKFFRSEWFGILTALDGELLIQKLREEKRNER